MEPVDEVNAIRELLLAKLATLAAEVSDGPVPPAPAYAAVEPLLSAWGKIPADTLGQIGEMCFNLERLAALKALPGWQAKMAMLPAQQVIEALDNLITRIREKKDSAAA
jgi:hypothetical protein